LSSGQQLIVTGLALGCWQAWRKRDFRALACWLGLTLGLPFATVVSLGYLGYGTVAALTVLIFLSGFVKNRAAVVAIAVLVGYVGLSAYVTYMRDRSHIRQTVWGGESLRVRIDEVGNTFKDFEWFDPSNTEQLSVIDGRFNQSFLTGLAVDRLSTGGVDYARGATLWDAVLMLIPRAIWPDKPIEAGSGNLVSQYTGLHFDKETSVGIGQVLEFYINFGTVGVVVGFLLMGILVTLCDLAAADRLALNDLHGFVLWYLPGISLLQVGGQLVEVTGSAAASIAVAFLANKYLDRLNGKHVDVRRALSPALARSKS
jgi:hypothetical protein